MIVVERARVSQVTPGNTRHSPRNGFTAYFVLSPAIGFFVTVARGNPANLTPASRRQDHTTSPSACRRPRRLAPPASTAPRPAFVTIAKRPSEWDGIYPLYSCFYQFEKRIIFRKGAGQVLLICPSGRVDIHVRRGNAARTPAAARSRSATAQHVRVGSRRACRCGPRADLSGSSQRGVQLWRDAEHLAERGDRQRRRDVRPLARFHFAPSKNFPHNSPSSTTSRRRRRCDG
jgi:hypothetical protein